MCDFRLSSYCSYILLNERRKEVEKAQEEMFRAKDKYQATQDKVKRLLEKKKKQNQKELLDAYEKTNRSHEEILRFMLGLDGEEDD